MAKTECLDDDEVTAFVAATVDETERARVEAHVATCSACRRVISETVKGLADDAARPSSPELAPLRKGDRLGRYQIVDFAGAGAMGLIYVARDEALSRDIALKLLRGSATSHHERLATEAKTMARLSHPNVVTVFDVGIERDQMFVAMELVEGQTLAAWLATSHPWQDVRRVFVQAGRGLAAAHAAGIVHRDFKPDNVLVGRDGRVRVTDFGLACSVDAAADGSIAGTPAYMAPAQLAGEPADAASDQFSFCAVLYEALWQQRPFTGDSVDELRAAIVRGIQIPRSPRVPAWLARIVTRGLAADPRRRYSSMPALLRELDRRRIAKPLALGVAAAAIAGAAGGIAIHRAATAESCDQPSLTWDAESVRTAFVATGLPYAQSTFDRVQRRLDAHAERWATLANESCRAKRLAAHRDCLDDRRLELAALVEQFAHVERDGLEDAIDAAAQLAPITTCASEPERQGRAAALHPARVALARALVARASALASTRSRAAQPMVAEALAATEDLGIPALAARAKLAECDLEWRRSRWPAAEAACLAATSIADSASLDAIKVRALANLVYVVGARQTRFTEAHAFALLARGALERVDGDDTRLRAYLLEQEARVALVERKHAEALAAAEQALQLYEATAGTDDPRSLGVTVVITSAHERGGDLDAALAIATRSLARHGATFGEHHPATARAHFVLSQTLRKLGRHDEAIAQLRTTLEIREATLGRDHPTVGATVNAIAISYGETGRVRDAVPLLERALAIAELHDGRRSSEAGGKHVNLANVYLLLDDVAAAEPHARAALEILVERVGADHPNVGAARIALAEVHRKRGQWQAALDQDEAALAIMEARLGKHHAEIHAPLLGIGLAYLALNKPELAREPLERAYAIDSKGDALSRARTGFALARVRSPVDVTLARSAKQLLAGSANDDAVELRAEIDAWLAKSH